MIAIVCAILFALAACAAVGTITSTLHTYRADVRALYTCISLGEFSRVIVWRIVEPAKQVQAGPFAGEYFRASRLDGSVWRSRFMDGRSLQPSLAA